MGLILLTKASTSVSFHQIPAPHPHPGLDSPPRILALPLSLLARPTGLLFPPKKQVLNVTCLDPRILSTSKQGKGQGGTPGSTEPIMLGAHLYSDLHALAWAPLLTPCLASPPLPAAHPYSSITSDSHPCWFPWPHGLLSPVPYTTSMLASLSPPHGATHPSPALQSGQPSTCSPRCWPSGQTGSLSL
jgi:hypothetical protein